MCNTCNHCGCNRCGCNGCCHGNAFTRAIDNLFSTCNCGCNGCNNGCGCNRSGCGCGCGSSVNLSAFTSCNADNDAYYARQYALTTNRSGCGCGCRCSHCCNF